MATYGLKYYAEFRNYRGQDYRLEVLQRGYSGSTKKMGALSGCVLEVQGNMGSIIAPIVKTQLRFSLIDAPDMPAVSGVKFGDWQEFYTPDSTLYKVVLKCYIGGAWSAEWSGYITPDSWQESLEYRGAITVTARDCIGHLKDFPFKAEGSITPDENGLISIFDIIEKALEVIELPMTHTWGFYSPTSRSGYLMTAALLNASIFEGMNWYEAMEQTLEAIGYVLRFVGGNTITICTLRDLPELGRYYETTGTQALEFYGGTLELDPAVKRIEEEQDYKQQNEVGFEVMAGLTFGNTTTYRCKTDGNQLPGGGTVSVPEHDADKNLVTGKGQTGWDLGSGMLNPSLYEADVFLTRAEGDQGWRNYAFIAGNQVLNGSSPTATYRFKTRTCAVKLTLRFAPNPGVIEDYGSDAGKMTGKAHYALSNIKYYVMYTDGSVTRYWNGGQWDSSAYLNSKDFDAQNKYETDLEIELAECGDIVSGTLVVELAQVTYKMWSAGGHGCYARLAELKAEITGPTALKGNKVTTINNDAYNVKINRRPLFGALSKDMGFVKPGNYRAGLFYYESLGAAPELFPYKVAWDSDVEESETVPLPVLIHQQILCYYYGAARVLQGACGRTNNDLFRFNNLNTYKGHTYIFQGGTMDYFSGTISNATFREFLTWNELWSGNTPSYDEEIEYNR